MGDTGSIRGPAAVPPPAPIQRGDLLPAQSRPPDVPLPAARDSLLSRLLPAGWLPGKAVSFDQQVSGPSPESLTKSARQAYLKGQFEKAAALYVRLAESHRSSRDVKGAALALQEAITIQYEKLHRLDPYLILTTDRLLQQVDADAARQFSAEMERRVGLLWQEWDLPRERPGDWRRALADPALEVFLQDVHGHRAAERRLLDMGQDFLDRAGSLLSRGSSYETVQAYRAAGAVYQKLGKHLEAARAYRQAAETAYTKLERLDPGPILAAHAAYQASGNQAAGQEWEKQVQGYVDRLWQRLGRTGQPLPWQQALVHIPLMMHFDDVQGRKAAAEQRQRVAQQKIEEKGFLDKLWDGAAAVGGVVWDTAGQVASDVAQPFKTAYEYYTDPGFTVGRLARDAKTVGGYVAGQAGQAVSGVVRTVTAPVVTAYEYYSDPGFSLGRFVKDARLAGEYLTEQVSGQPEAPPPPVNQQAAPLDLKALERAISKETGTVASPNRVRLYVDGHEAFPALHTLIHSAQHHIHVQIYMFDNDRTGYALADALIAKAKQGVQVRVLTDKLGGRIVNSSLDHHPGDRGNILDYLRRNGVQVIEEDNASLKSDHRKLVVVDGRRGMTGGMNFGNYYADEWHDFMLELEGPAVRRMQTAFLESWQQAGGQVPPGTEFLPAAGPLPGPAGEVAATRVLVTTPTNQEIKKALYTALDRARHHIYVEHAYLTDDDVVEKLVAARRRGVDVRVIIPAHSDMAVYDRSNRVSIQRLLQAGAQVYLYRQPIHGKAITIDGQWTTIGSANLSRRSLNANQEMNFAVADPQFARWTEQRIFEPDMEPARALHLTDPLEENLWDGLLNWLADKATNHF